MVIATLYIANLLEVLLNVVVLVSARPTHFSRLVHQHLNNVFENKWIDPGRAVSWSPWLPDNTFGLLLLRTHKDHGIH